MSETSSNCWKTITPARKWVRLSSLTYNAFLSCRGNGVINEAGCWNCLVGMTLGPSTLPKYQRVGGPVRSPHRLAATCQPTANGSRSGGVALLRPSRSALRRSELGHGHGQAIGARMHDSAPWKTEETIVGLPRLLVLSAFSRFRGCHLSAPPPSSSPASTDGYGVPGPRLKKTASYSLSAPRRNITVPDTLSDTNYRITGRDYCS